MVGEAVGARPPGRNLGPRHALGIIEQPGQMPSHAGRTVAAHQRTQFARPHLACGVLGAQIAEHDLRHADIEPDDGRERFVHLASMVQLERGDTQAFLVNLRAVGGVGAGDAAAHIGVVADHHRPGQQFALLEDGVEHEDVRQVHAARIRVIHHHRITG